LEPDKVESDALADGAPADLASPRPPERAAGTERPGLGGATAAHSLVAMIVCVHLITGSVVVTTIAATSALLLTILESHRR
jgi:hypothetical protein